MIELFPTMTGTAAFSECGTYRYDLTRRWGYGPVATFIMLNPSTADADLPDPTITRCIGYARSWGLDGLVVLNIFALRSTDPAALKPHPDPVGPCNDETIRRYVETAVAARSPIVAAWGVHGTLRGRDAEVHDLVTAAGGQLRCLSRTKAGHPGHPLYLKKTLPLIGL